MFRTTSLNSWVSACSVSQSCPTLCNTMDCSLPGSSVHGIFQARVLECVAISHPGNQTAFLASPALAGDSLSLATWKAMHRQISLLFSLIEFGYKFPWFHGWREVWNWISMLFLTWYTCKMLISIMQWQKLEVSLRELSILWQAQVLSGCLKGWQDK